MVVVAKDGEVGRCEVFISGDGGSYFPFFIIISVVFIMQNQFKWVISYEAKWIHG